MDGMAMRGFGFEVVARIEIAFAAFSFFSGM